MPTGPKVRDDGSLHISSRLVIPADEIGVRVTTSGGPGGQHANRSLTRVVVTFHVTSSSALSDADREQLLASAGPIIRSSAGRFRSQGQNRSAALEQMAQRIAIGLTRATPRRATKPTKASKRRRVDEKKARSRVKERRRRPDED